MGRKGHSITLSLQERDKAELEAIALELGIMWGDRPNISKLLEAIARRRVLIAPNHNWSDSRINALHRAMQALSDIGQMEQAELVAQLLLERSELSVPLRADIESFLHKRPPAWRIEIDRYILRQQPFELSYQDASERLRHFTIRHAKIVPHEKREYIDCWCEETTDNQDIPELNHNWSLRIDRITNDAALLPVKGEWRSHLDYIEVEMHLLRGLFFAYQPKPEDIACEQIPGDRRIRRVVRKVTSTFWFQREVLRYGKDCAVVWPENVRDRLKREILAMCQNYDIPTGE